jgi:hypothetical protein
MKLLKKQKNEPFVITQSAYDEIVRTVGSRPAESGGILLGSREDYIVQKFVFDPHGSMSHAAYDPDVNFLNKIVKKEWNENKLAFLGFVHSHPRGLSRLSGDYGGNTGDLGYMRGIFRAMPTLEKLLVPILFSPADSGELNFFPYMALRGREDNYFAGDLRIVHDDDFSRVVSPEQDAYRLDESRLQGSVDIDKMKHARVTCVGVGGANGICESLIRSGLTHINLIDFDRVDASNLTTQGFFIDDIGKLKVDALKERLMRINPNIEVNTFAVDFTKIGEGDMELLMKHTDLLLMMTDDFHAQAFGNKVALQYQVPAVFAMMYEKARAAEISFTIPGVTPACHRCAVSSRYDAYLNKGYKNEVTSVGSTHFHTGYLNNSIGLLALAILHNEIDDVEFSRWFGTRWEQNLVQLRLSPFTNSRLFNQLSHQDDRLRFFDAVWQHIYPDAPPNAETCPDCGGQGDLRDAFIHQQVIGTL